MQSGIRALALMGAKLRFLEVLACRDAAHSEAPQRDFEQSAQRQHRIDAGLGAELEHEDGPRFGDGGLGAVCGCHGHRSVDREKAPTIAIGA
jgi:hypothetical protein